MTRIGPTRRTRGRRGHPAGHVRRDTAPGQALVEFALVLPILLLLIAAIADFGFVLVDRMTLINASREGARAAVLRDPATQTIPGAVTSRVAAADGSLTTSTVVECQRVFPGGAWSVANCNQTDARFVRVTVSATHDVFFVPIQWAFGNTITLRSTAQMALQP